MDIVNHGEIFGTHHLPDGVMDHGGHNFSDLNHDLHSTYASDVESLSQGMDFHSPHLSHSFSHEFNPSEVVHSDCIAFSGTDFNAGFDHPSHLDHSFENQHLADYQPHHANSLLDHQYSQFDHPSHLGHSFENQHLADYQPHHANSLLDHQYSQFDHPSHLDHLSQRSGSASFTPSSPAEVAKNKEVIIKDEFGHEKSGTVTDKHSDGTYKVETSKEVYDKVSYHDVQKYGPK